MKAALPVPAWLAGKRALVCGSGTTLLAVADTLRQAGAGVFVDSTSNIADDYQDTLLRAETALGGELELLVHGGAPIIRRSPEATALEDWRAQVSGDLDGRFLQAQAFARQCIARRHPGAILYLLPTPLVAAGRVGHITTVGALANMIKTLSVEWARDGIRVNGIASQACEYGASLEPQVLTALANLCAYLLSDYAAYITGMMTGIHDFAIAGLT